MSTLDTSPMVTDALLQQLCKELQLPTVYLVYKDLARQAEDQSQSYGWFLQRLLEQEVQKRRDNAVARRLREAKFPDLKTFDQVDWSAMKGISKVKIQTLSSGQFIDEKEDVIILGPIGTGKTHIAIALGVEAARRRRKVIFIRASELIRSLVEARDERQLTRLHNHYRKVQLLIIDELGFVPMDKTEAELFFNLLADRYERAATVVTSNLAFGEWVQVFGCEKLTTALLDRLAHHAHVLATKGRSYRTLAPKQTSQTSQETQTLPQNETT